MFWLGFIAGFLTCVGIMVFLGFRAQKKQRAVIAGIKNSVKEALGTLGQEDGEEKGN